jgi:hypothetical protein
VTANGYTGNPPGGGGGGGSVAWTDITGKPSTFPPSAHTQAASTISDSTAVGRAVMTAVDAAAARTATGAAATSHAHVVADVTSLQGFLDAKAPLASPTFTGTVSGIASAMVGLGNVDNTADTVKPVSTAQQTALNFKADLASPTLTGTPAAPTATPGTNTTQVATTAFVTAAVAAGGGGGGTAPTFTRAYLSAGDKTPGVTASWTPITGMTLVIAAAAGDDITLTINGLLNQTATDFFEMVVLVGGSIVKYSSTGTGSPSGAGEGDASIYPMSGVSIRATTAQWSFTTDSGDISGGNVTLALAFKGSGSGKVFASTNYPFRWSVRNDH